MGLSPLWLNLKAAGLFFAADLAAPKGKVVALEERPTRGSVASPIAEVPC